MQCEIHRLIIHDTWRTLKSPMKPPGKWRLLPVPPRLNRKRIAAAFAVAVVADGLQLCLGPFGWEFGDQIIDVVAMLLTIRILGFHLLLLPTFFAELLPLVDDLPTWTACVAAVVFLRKREQNSSPPPSPAPPVSLPQDKPVIDI